MVDYRDALVELRDRSAGQRLAELGLGLDKVYFVPDGERLFTRHIDGRAYLLDLPWLQAMGGDPAALFSDELVRMACKGPLATGLFDPDPLTPYLQEIGVAEPGGCDYARSN